jgi:hypothetical protein
MAEIFAQQTTIPCGRINSPLIAYLAVGTPHSDGLYQHIPGRNILAGNPARYRMSGSGV